MRIGYLIVPEELIGPAREAKAFLNNGNPWLEQAVLAEFIKTGRFEKHLRKIRQIYLLRRNTLLDELKRRFGEIQVSGEAAGMHLTWHLPNTMPKARSIQYECLHYGVGIYSINDGPALDLAQTNMFTQMLFFGYPCLNEREIVTAMDRLESTIISLTR